MRTKAQIEAKWEKKLKEIRLSTEIQYERKIRDAESKAKSEFERLRMKYERKKNAYLNKKELEYKRKMLNEIRELEGKPKKEYKSTKKFNVLGFAMDLQQENSKLRDSDENGDGHCISCNCKCSWNNSHGGHCESRKTQNICIDPTNINLQCRNCNLITGPLGNVELKYKTQLRYYENLDKKFGEGTSERLRNKKRDYYSKGYESNGDFGQGNIPLEDYIVQMIIENESLWATKNFYKPKRKWRKEREAYKGLN